MILSINDASHAASFDVDKNGRPIGHRSQSGRILALASEDFEKDGSGKVHMAFLVEQCDQESLQINPTIRDDELAARQ